MRYIKGDRRGNRSLRLGVRRSNGEYEFEV